MDRVDVIQWSEDLYERILIDRTIDACKGQVDVVIDFGTTSRSLNRSLQCLNKGGVVFIGHETADRLMPKFARKADDLAVSIQSVELGSIEQLNELVQLVSSGQVAVAFFCFLCHLFFFDRRARLSSGATAALQRLPGRRGARGDQQTLQVANPRPGRPPVPLGDAVIEKKTKTNKKQKTSARERQRRAAPKAKPKSWETTTATTTTTASGRGHRLIVIIIIFTIILILFL